MRDIILFGMQGSGKGTQARILAKEFDYKIFETGSQLRKLASEDSELGREVKEITTTGKLVSNEIVMKIVATFLNELNKDEKAIFDGIPRSEQQRVSLEAELEKADRKPLAVYISLTRTEALRRLLGRKTCADCGKIFGVKDGSENLKKCAECGGELKIRADDTKEAIETRLGVYEGETLPAIEKYRENGRLVEIEGIKSVEEVNRKIVEEIQK